MTIGPRPTTAKKQITIEAFLRPPGNEISSDATTAFFNTLNEMTTQAGFKIIGDLMVFESRVIPLDALKKDGTNRTFRLFIDDKLPKRAIFLALEYVENRKFTHYKYGVFTEKPLPLTSLPKPPENAFLLYAKPPMWLQICGETIIITRGMFWCRETRLKEYEDEHITIQKNGTEWLIRINGINVVPYGSILRLYPEINGIYRAAHGRLYAINYEPPENAVSTFPEKRAIIYSDGKYIEHDILHDRELTVADEKDLKFIKITGEKTLYVPAYYIQEVLP